jgi:4-amino-4-deoxy-L-arabinose transferase-like glycosyltransferase
VDGFARTAPQGEVPLLGGKLAVEETEVRDSVEKGACGKGGMAGVWWIAAGTVVVHMATGWRYGFNRDELMALEDARHLAWGYVQYPPMTAFFGWIALKLFGVSLVGFRFFPGLAQALALLLTTMMAKEFGGGKWAQIVAAGAGVPFCLGGGALMQYISFDYVCWVLVAYGMVRVLHGAEQARNERTAKPRNGKGEDPRRTTIDRDSRDAWWVLVGLGIGLGMMAKYTMGFLAVGVAVGVLATVARRCLLNGWLWLGVLVAVGIWAPNVWWQWQHDLVSLDFLRFLHQRDVAEGLTDWFLPGQLELTLLAFPLALAGLWFCFFAQEGKAWRAVGWMYVVPLLMFVVLRGRNYYLAPAYPMLYAAGAVWTERKLRNSNDCMGSLTDARERHGLPLRAELVRRTIVAVLVLDAMAAGCVALPIMPVNSWWWKLAAQVDTVLPEEIGWPELAETVAKIRDGLPEADRAKVGILAGNYGEVGALNLYGQKYGLPRAISGVNSSWERGYGHPPPETVIVVGLSREFLQKNFTSCELAAHTWNRYGIANEETIEDPDIFVCRGLQGSWDELWNKVRLFA